MWFCGGLGSVGWWLDPVIFGYFPNWMMLWLYDLCLFSFRSVVQHHPTMLCLCQSNLNPAALQSWAGSCDCWKVLFPAGAGVQQELLHCCSFPSKMSINSHSRPRMVDMSALISLSVFTTVRISVFISEVHNSCLNCQKLLEEISSKILDLRACQNLQMAVHGNVNWWTCLSNCPWGRFFEGVL